jgi:transcriptional regulator with XRE-family HTH domain
LARAVKSTNGADQALGAAIRMWRRARRISQHTLASTCGVTFQQVRKYEAAADRISISRLARIAASLRCRCHDLVAFLDLDGDAAETQVTLTNMTPDRLELLFLYIELAEDQVPLVEAFLQTHPRGGQAG